MGMREPQIREISLKTKEPGIQVVKCGHLSGPAIQEMTISWSCDEAYSSETSKLIGTSKMTQ